MHFAHSKELIFLEDYSKNVTINSCGFTHGCRGLVIFENFKICKMCIKIFNKCKNLGGLAIFFLQGGWLL